MQESRGHSTINTKGVLEGAIRRKDIVRDVLADMLGRQAVLTFKSRMRFQLPWFGLALVALLSGSAFGTLPDCAAVPANLSYVLEDCFNATHRRVQTGQCINGVAQGDTVTLQSCREYSPFVGAEALGSSSTATNQDFYCHACGDHRTVCSELEARPQACAAHVNDDTFCRQVQSIASFSGCLSFSHYFTAVEYCQTGGEADALITPHSCAEDFGEEFSRCMSCKDGLRICAQTEAVECEEIGLPSAATTDSSDGADGQNNGDNTIDDSDEFGSIDCNQFWGDVQFYGEECFNKTHRVVTSGLCVEGQVQGLSFQTNPCSDDGDDMLYCHDCNGKAVCASTEIKFNLCDENDEIRSCSAFYDRTAHWAGCGDEVRETTRIFCGDK